MGSTDPSSFVRLEAQTAWRGHRIRVERHRYRSPEGEEFEREFMAHPGAVGIIAVDDTKNVYLVRQFRVPMGQWILEMPAGTCDVTGEDPETTARRELAEEVGLVAANWTLLGALPVSPGVSDQVTRIYLATGLSPCDTDREGPEERAMTVSTVPLEEVLDIAAHRTPLDAPTIAGAALAWRALTQGT